MKDGLDYKVMMQPNLGCGIIVTLRINTCMAYSEPILNSCFNEEPLVDSRRDLDFLVLEHYSRCSRTWSPKRSMDGATLLKRRLGSTRSFYNSWKPAFSRASISICLRLVSSSQAKQMEYVAIPIG